MTTKEKRILTQLNSHGKMVLRKVPKWSLRPLKEEEAFEEKYTSVEPTKTMYYSTFFDSVYPHEVKNLIEKGYVEERKIADLNTYHEYHQITITPAGVKSLKESKRNKRKPPEYFAFEEEPDE